MYVLYIVLHAITHHIFDLNKNQILTDQKLTKFLVKLFLNAEFCKFLFFFIDRSSVYGQYLLERMLLLATILGEGRIHCRSGGRLF